MFSEHGSATRPLSYFTHVCVLRAAAIRAYRAGAHAWPSVLVHSLLALLRRPTVSSRSSRLRITPTT
jgi:hypothetical protein